MPGNVGHMRSLTRQEAVDRAAGLHVQGYRIALDLTGEGAHFDSDTTITFRTRPGTRTSFLDLQPASVELIELNGDRLPTSAVRDGRLVLTDLPPDNVLRVVARMPYSTDGEGLYRHVDPADGKTYLYAMSFLDNAPRWFACFDQPDLKARYTLRVRCPPDWTVRGNGAATEHRPGHWSLAETPPLSTYFVTLIAGPYHSIASEHDGIVLGLHCRTSLAPHLDREAADLLEVTRACLHRYHELFGIRYPFGEYHQAFVPDFNAGAMENPGCVTLRDQYVFRSAATRGERGTRAATIAHEMAHMWFGDLVTMLWWDDLWLNESLAEYLAQRVCSEVTQYPAWIDFGIHRKDWGSVADQAPSSHPVASNGSADAAAALADFDGISYAKGASVLKQLAIQLGDAVFLAGLRAYFTAHSFGNATFDDLIHAWTSAGARDLNAWAEQWLRTTGLDTLSADHRDGEIVLTRSAWQGSNRQHAIRVMAFDSHSNRLMDSPLSIGCVPARMPVPADTRLVVADGNDDTWARASFGGHDWHTIGRVLPGIKHPASRVVIYNAIRDSVRAAELDPNLALELLLPGAAAEPEDLVTADVLRFATEQLVAVFTPVGERPGRTSRIAELAGELLGEALPGTDAQLESARALVRTTDDATLLLGWLAGLRVPDGLAIDAELRWALIYRLTVLGAASESAIGLELGRDPSASGAVHAARARAAIPDPDAKAAAWRLLVEPSEASAYQLYATAEGFFQAGQTGLTSEYAERYFGEIPATAAHRQGWALSRVAMSSYPITHASRAVLRLADQTLLRAGLAPGIRRAFEDGTDMMRRAVASQLRFAAR